MKLIKKINKSISKLRIISGIYKGKMVYFYPRDVIRPTKNSVKETLFSWLNDEIKNSICLDLFAGSGSMGFEAISRGAREVHFVEKCKISCNSIYQNASNLKCSEKISIYNENSINFLKRNDGKTFNIVFIDPPFFKEYIEECLHLIKKLTNYESKIYIETNNSNITFDSYWKIIKSKKNGDISFFLLMKNN